MNRCPHCPAGPGCLALAVGNPRYCTLADPASPDHHPDIVPILRGEPHPDYARQGVAPPASPAPTRPGVADSVRIAMAVNRCPVRQTVGCGCADRSALCFRSGSPAVRTHAECEACVDGR